MPLYQHTRIQDLRHVRDMFRSLQKSRLPGLFAPDIATKSASWGAEKEIPGGTINQLNCIRKRQRHVFPSQAEKNYSCRTAPAEIRSLRLNSESDYSYVPVKYTEVPCAAVSDSPAL